MTHPGHYGSVSIGNVHADESVEISQGVFFPDETERDLVRRPILYSQAAITSKRLRPCEADEENKRMRPCVCVRVCEADTK